MRRVDRKDNSEDPRFEGEALIRWKRTTTTTTSLLISSQEHKQQNCGVRKSNRKIEATKSYVMSMRHTVSESRLKTHLSSYVQKIAADATR